MQGAEEDIQAKSRNYEDSINFRPSPNFKHMKKYLKSKFEESNQMSDQSSPTEVANAPMRTNIQEEVKNNVNVQPPLPPNPPPPDTPPMIINLKQEIVDDEYQKNDVNSQEFVQTDELRTTIKTDQSEAIDEPKVIMCRNFVRGTCKKGAACIFAHKLILSQLPGVYTFCRNFQNSVCSFPKCKFVHATVFEKEYFFRSGYLPPHTLAHLKENISTQPDPPPQTEETAVNTPPAPYPLGLAPPPPPAKPCMPTHMNYAVPDSTCNVYKTPVLGQKRAWTGDEQEVSSSTEVPLLRTGGGPDKKCKTCDSAEIREELLKLRYENQKKQNEELLQKSRVLSMKTAKLTSAVAAFVIPKMSGTTKGKDLNFLLPPSFASYVAKMLLNPESRVPPDTS